ncbi:OmpA family protein [Cesiribacter sp. SM1]|uniref:OmpA family protein n=1 Tax=Cesiribacter sp. SM1 TaxID=2861196 RepID=UPI001CD3AB14|nr:OmpA family protein [Cesiribacter sp. SM1]
MNFPIKHLYKAALMVLLTSGAARAQSNFAPQRVEESINSTYAEINPVLSPDGNELFFVRANHPQNGFGENDSEDIWYSKRGEDGKWSEAVRIPQLNIGRYNAVWAVTQDGSAVLIQGQYNKDGDFWKKRGFSLVRRTASGEWEKPVKVSLAKFNKKNRGLYTTAYLTPDGRHVLMSFSNKFNSKKSRLYVSHEEVPGFFDKPRKIKIKQGSALHAPSVSADGKKLYYTSSQSGNSDVWVAERLDESWRKWSEPKPVQSINTANWESYFRTNVKGSQAWYAARAEKGSNPDLYTIKLFEENPFIVVSGQVINKKTNLPITNLTEVALYANDSLENSLVVREDGSYTMKLPLGKNYQLKPQLAHYDADPASVKADSLFEYTETSLNLYFTPWTVVKVSGKLLERSTLAPFPAEAKARLLVNGKEPDSLVMNPATGEYSLWLPYGKNYQLQVQAKGHKTEEQPLLLDKVKAYQVITRDLYASKVNTATVQGRLLDRKTGKTFPAGVPVKVMLNDTLQLTIIDTLGTYSVPLALGNAYSLSAKAEGYYPITELIDLSGEEKQVKVYKDLYLAPVEVGESIRLNNVFFENAKSTLKPESFTELDRVVTFLQENPNMKIEIAGHTDNKGTAALNKKLSGDRASAVAKYITSQGIPADRLTSRGYGSTKPEADNKTEEGRSRNRRVEFTILEIKK